MRVAFFSFPHNTKPASMTGLVYLMEYTWMHKNNIAAAE